MHYVTEKLDAGNIIDKTEEIDISGMSGISKFGLIYALSVLIFDEVCGQSIFG